MISDMFHTVQMYMWWEQLTCCCQSDMSQINFHWKCIVQTQQQSPLFVYPSTNPTCIVAQIC